MSSFVLRRGVVGVILREGRFLVIRRSRLVTAPGTFCFPGGGIEAGESEPDAIVRELEEELCIEQALPVSCVWRCRTARRVELAWWYCTVPNDQSIVPNPLEVSAYHWWSAEDLAGCGNLLQSNEEFLAEMQSGRIQIPAAV